MIRPIWSTDLLGLSEDSNPNLNTTQQTTTSNELWPKSYSPLQANTIFVKPDWSDLEDTIMYLRDNPDVAERVARNQRESIVERGYLSPAAEVCYWRALVRGWSGVVRGDESWEGVEGVRWEGFSLTGKTKW